MYCMTKVFQNQPLKTEFLQLLQDNILFVDIILYFVNYVKKGKTEEIVR